MLKTIYIHNLQEKVVGDIYKEFLKYAFSKTDYFMLVYVNYYNKGYTPKQRYFRDRLQPFKVKSRSNPSWPGTPKTNCPDTSYKIVFYRTDEKAMEILSEASGWSAWSRPGMPEDLAFFSHSQCWAYSTGHEQMATVLCANEEDINTFQAMGIIDSSSVVDFAQDQLKLYEESILK